MRGRCLQGEGGSRAEVSSEHTGRIPGSSIGSAHLQPFASFSSNPLVSPSVSLSIVLSLFLLTNVKTHKFSQTHTDTHSVQILTLLRHRKAGLIRLLIPL